jgi:hypothetical protein
MGHFVALDINSSAQIETRTFVDITLNHETTDKTFAIGNLFGDIFGYDRLIFVILTRIAMRTIDHDTLA